MAGNRVVVVGSSNTDMVVKSERIPRPGETVIGGAFLLAPGGKGANQAVAAARLGADVTFIAKIGEDIFGNQALEGFRREGICTEFVFRDADHVTGVALILVDEKGENSISVASGANEFLTPADIEKAESAIAEAKVVVTQLETPLDVLYCVSKMAAQYDVPLILDPAPAPQAPLPLEILRNVAVIKPNETEAERLTGIRVENPESACAAGEKLLAAGVKAAIITRGAEGVFLVEKPGEVQHFPAFSVNAVDTTAAGDAFSGALAFGLAAGKSLCDAIKIALAVAALSTTRMGAQPSLPTAEELEKFLQKIS